MQRRAPLIALALVTAVALVACGGDDDGAIAAPEPTLSARVDWTARTVEVTGETPFEVAFCEGDGPFLCITRDGEHLGAAELLELAAVVEVDAWAADFYDSIAEDRKVGCNPDYVLEGDELEAAPFGGGDGVQYGFTGTIDGARVERVVGHLAVLDGSTYLLAVNALADEGCLAREGELPIDVVDDVEPLLAALAAGSALPAATGGTALDGTHTGFLADTEGRGTIGLDLAEMLDGEEAVEAAAADGETLEVDFYIDNDDPSVVALTVDDDTTVELYDCTAACELRKVAVGDFTSGKVVPFGGAHAFVEVVVDHGTVVSLREVYLP